jgi:general stress protein 26
MFTTKGKNGLLSRPLTVTELDGNGDLWFFSTVDSGIVDEVKANHGVNVSFGREEVGFGQRPGNGCL